MIVKNNFVKSVVAIQLLICTPASLVDADSENLSCESLVGNPYELDSSNKLKGVALPLIDFDQAIRICKDSVQDDPASIESRFYLGRALMAARNEEAGDYLKFAAESGHAGAMTTYGMWLGFYSQPRDENSAHFWIKRASDAGYLPAKALLAFLKINGVGVEKDMKQAILDLEMEYASGNKFTRRILGHYYLNSAPPFQDFGRAYIMLTEAISDNDRLTHSLMGDFFKIGASPWIGYDSSAGWCPYIYSISNTFIAKIIASACGIPTETKPDLARAIEYYNAGAKLGDPRAFYNLALLADNTDDWLSYMERASDKYEEAAHLELGDAYYSGKKVARDLKKAADYWMMAAKNGSSSGLHNMAVLHINGEGVTANEDKAYEYLKLAANKGNLESQYLLGYMLAYTKDASANRSSYLEEGKRWLEQSAKQGHPKAMFYLAGIYSRGTIVPKDLVRETELLRSAANLGFAPAQRELAYKLLNEKSSQSDLKEASALLTQAANQNDADAQYSLGWMYSIGKGVAQDYKVARELYEKSADKKNHNAYVALGVIYLNGYGTNKDELKAFKNFEAGANLGSAKGHLILGDLYRLGIGTTFNIVSAKQHLRIAQNTGDNEISRSASDILNSIEVREQKQISSNREISGGEILAGAIVLGIAALAISGSTSSSKGKKSETQSYNPCDAYAGTAWLGPKYAAPAALWGCNTY